MSSLSIIKISLTPLSYADTAAASPADAAAHRYKHSLPPLKPKAYNDTAMAELFVHEYQGEIRYNPSTGWLVWTGRRWEVSELKAIAEKLELVNRQLAEKIYEFYSEE